MEGKRCYKPRVPCGGGPYSTKLRGARRFSVETEDAEGRRRDDDRAEENLGERRWRRGFRSRRGAGGVVDEQRRRKACACVRRGGGRRVRLLGGWFARRGGGCSRQGAEAETGKTKEKKEKQRPGRRPLKTEDRREGGRERIGGGVPRTLSLSRRRRAAARPRGQCAEEETPA